MELIVNCLPKKDLYIANFGIRNKADAATAKEGYKMKMKKNQFLKGLLWILDLVQVAEAVVVKNNISTYVIF